MSDKKPLYFLTHEGQPYVFSAFGLPLEEEKKSPLAGMLLLDRPSMCPDWFLERLTGTFGKIILAPMTMKRERGLYTRMKITDPFSLDLVMNGIYGPSTEKLGSFLQYIHEAEGAPSPRLNLQWSKADGLWISDFDLGP